MTSLTGTEKQKYTDLFKKMDKDHGKGNGRMEVGVFEKLLMECGLQCPRFLVAEVFVKWDGNQDWKISLQEFLDEMEKMLYNPSPINLLGRIRQHFLKGDFTKDGFLSREELKKLIDTSCASNPRYKDDCFDKYFDRFDTNKDGRISFGEFIKLYIEDIGADSDEDEDDAEQVFQTHIEPDKEDKDSATAKMRRKFEKSDLNKDGYLSISEARPLILEVFPGIDQEEVEEVFAMWDSNKDGRLDMMEFIPVFVSLMWGDSSDEESYELAEVEEEVERRLSEREGSTSEQEAAQK